MTTPRYLFKIAETAQEFDDIHRLLYRTFVVEVPRYDDPGTGQLIDKFHERNLYFIAVREGQLCGVIAVHDQPPFSVSDILDDPSVLTSLGPRLLETRLFAIEPQNRFSFVFAGLGYLIFNYAESSGHRNMVISGLAARQKMYEQLGFRPLGPPALKGNEYFTPMSIDLSDLPEKVKQNLNRWNRRR